MVQGLGFRVVQALGFRLFRDGFDSHTRTMQARLNRPGWFRV